MFPLYNTHGLVFWPESMIQLRQQFMQQFAGHLLRTLSSLNPAWRMQQIEAPLLTPRALINPNYTDDDVWAQQHDGHPLVLRPETTPGSYVYMRHLLDTHTNWRPPMIVWQAGKSFRREPAQPYSNMRLAEFYQQEFQCLYTADSMADYHAFVQEPMRKALQDAVGRPMRLVPSDRLPAYSRATMDIEVDLGDRWMEVCSISLRTDFPGVFVTNSKAGQREHALLVVEVAIGLDRCLYAYDTKD